MKIASIGGLYEKLAPILNALCVLHDDHSYFSCLEISDATAEIISVLHEMESYKAGFEPEYHQGLCDCD